MLSKTARNAQFLNGMLMAIKHLKKHLTKQLKQ